MRSVRTATPGFFFSGDQTHRAAQWHRPFGFESFRSDRSIDCFWHPQRPLWVVDNLAADGHKDPLNLRFRHCGIVARSMIGKYWSSRTGHIDCLLKSDARSPAAARDSRNFSSYVFWRKNKVYASAFDSTFRHVGLRGGIEPLRNDDTSSFPYVA